MRMCLGVAVEDACNYCKIKVEIDSIAYLTNTYQEKL